MRAILTYHSIDGSGSPISLPESVFRAHVRFLASGRLRVVPLAELPALPDEPDAVALTFDDGFENFSTTALPLLREYGLPATVFVVSDHVGRTNEWGGRADAGIPVLPLMTWDQVGQAADAGIEIGAHTRRHADLVALQPAAVGEEISGSVDTIARQVGRRPTTFAYPYGRYSDAVVAAVGRRCRIACTTDLRILSSADDLLTLPRLDAWYFQSAGQLEQWGSPRFRRRLWLRARGRDVRRLVLERSGSR